MVIQPFQRDHRQLGYQNESERPIFIHRHWHTNSEKKPGAVRWILFVNVPSSTVIEHVLCIDVSLREVHLFSFFSSVFLEAIAVMMAMMLFIYLSPWGSTPKWSYGDHILICVYFYLLLNNHIIPDWQMNRQSRWTIHFV